MKKFFSLCLLMIMSISVFAKQADIFTVKGTLKDKENVPVMYANVVLLNKADKSVANGGVSTEEGKFSLSVPAGDYTLSVSFMGYKTVNKDLSVKSNIDLGAIKMETDAAVLSDVTITAKMTERKGDRLVVNLASSPLVEGKTTKDIINYTPGVWLDNKGEISINGKKNVRVMINDRDVKMSGEELLTYLESLQASDVLKIEVI
ncbi:MAG: carboxypeptidase-like regulatory domain-containing protein, partial [Flavobacteriales bacterium]|nr:carboxypeptidase-like regulatory domain-containing protein [Flavobacteriales bacterium]